MLSNLSEEYEEKLKTIKKHFGEINQKAKLLEELEEVDNEFGNFEYGITEINIILEDLKNKDQKIINILNEIADCFVVAVQLNKEELTNSILEGLWSSSFDDGHLAYIYILYDMESEVLEIARQKIDRTLERIESGYYEPDICPECNGKGSIRLPYGRTYTLCKKCKGTGRKEK